MFDFVEFCKTRTLHFVQLGFNASKYQIICRFVATFGNSTQDLTLRKRPVLDI